MRTPGLTATASFGRTARGRVDGMKPPLLDAEPPVVPAQIDRVSRFLSAPGGARWLWADRPACPLGQRAVWVDRDEEYYDCFDDTTGLPTKCRIPPFHGWECQSAFLVVP
jgi:hypothetical protein